MKIILLLQSLQFRHLDPVTIGFAAFAILCIILIILSLGKTGPD